MNILIIADPIITVPPENYGGAERIIDLYAREFNRLGHNINLMAANGSDSYGGKLYAHKAPTKNYISRARRKIQFQLQSIYAAKGSDLIFNHGRFDYLEVLLRLGKPIVHYQHNPLDPQQINFMEARAHKRLKIICISYDQLSSITTKINTQVIHNFVDTRTYKFSSKGEGYLAYLGRLTENKGIHIAIKIAKLTGKKLKIAGIIPSESEDQKFYKINVLPFIDNELVEYIGPVNNVQKEQFLGNAEALIFPGLWREPCAVVISESFACGTPVIAFDVASNGELIDDGVTGYLCDPEEGIEGMAKRVEKLNLLSRKKCRETSEDRFDVRIAASSLLTQLA